MNQKINNSVNKILILFLLCSVVEYIGFLFIRTDQTVIADNIGTKIFCIFAIVFMLKCTNLRLADIRFRARGVIKSLLSGLALGIITFGISYLLRF